MTAFLTYDKFAYVSKTIEIEEDFPSKFPEEVKGED